MTNKDMTWEQKCRISALRAACASSFDLHGVMEEGHPESFRGETDESMTARILTRAEEFRIALMGTGALDAHPSDEEPPEAHLQLSTCKYCMTAIGRHDDGTWINNAGTRYCGTAQTLTHSPNNAELSLPESNVCPKCGSSRKDTPLMIGDYRQCVHAWHQS